MNYLLIFIFGLHPRILKLGEDSQINAVIDILKDMKTDGVAGELLVSLLKVFFVLYLIQILKTK